MSNNNNNNLQQLWEHTYRQHQAAANILMQKHDLQTQLQSHHALEGITTSSSTVATTTSFISTTNVANSATYAFVERLSGHNDYDDTTAFDSYYFINNNIFSNSSNSLVSTDAEFSIPSLTVLFMAISYGLVVFGGVLGNATLVLTLCSASSVRLRNPLLLAVCIADLLVTGISAPITLLNLAMNRTTKSLPMSFCKLIHYIQIMPVAASTISFFLLSLDRYATVKHPRLAQLRQRRYLHVILALVSWMISAAISTPFLFAYQIIEKTTSAHKLNISCASVFADNRIFTYFVYFHTFAVFVLPGLGVLLNHYGVRQKLCALSLTARAAHGELPLPMPILRRQTHMVIVTGIANPQNAAGTQTEDTSNDDADGGDCGGAIQLHNLNAHVVQIENAAENEEEEHEQVQAEEEDQLGDIETPVTIPLSNRRVLKTTNPISPRAMREIRAHSQRQRIQNNNNNNNNNNRGSSIRRQQMAGSCVPATPGIPLPQTSTLHSRRRLANMLIASALIFIICWAPHVFCIFYTNFGYRQYCDTTATYFNLLLGYMYSAISPVIYWILNHNTLRQSPCAPIIRMRSMQNFLRARFRTHTVPPPPASSTNEAALGAFNPKFIKLTPKQYRAQASSHYLY